jgi:hypothetical protein
MVSGMAATAPTWIGLPAAQASTWKTALSSVWAKGVRRILLRREILTAVAIAVAFLLASGCLFTCFNALFRPWLSFALAASAIASFFLFLLWLYEHARTEELIEAWISGLPQLLGVHPTAAEALSWAEHLLGLQTSQAVPAWRRSIAREILNHCAERLLVYAQELAVLAVLRDPIEWTGHAELARVLATMRSLLGDEDPRSEELKHRVLDELSILQSLHPQVPDVWRCCRDCAEMLVEPEVELLALEKLSSLLPEKEPLVEYGLALFRYGFSGRAFSLYRQLRQEDPDAAQAILEGYRSGTFSPRSI